MHSTKDEKEQGRGGMVLKSSQSIINAHEEERDLEVSDFLPSPNSIRVGASCTVWYFDLI